MADRPSGRRTSFRCRRGWPNRRLFIVVVAVVTVRAAVDMVGRRDRPAFAPLAEGPYQVVQVPDGFHLVVAPTGMRPANRVRVRLMGIRPLERDSHSSSSDKALAAAAHRWLENETKNRVVTLRLDRRRIDRDGSWLAYVFVDQTLVNAQIVRHGWARTDVRSTDSSSISRLLAQAEAEARQGRCGAWQSTRARKQRQDPHG